MLALVGPLIGLLFGAVLRCTLHPSRRLIVSVLVAAFFFATGAAVVSGQYPGPASKYTDGTVGWAVREWVIAPGIALILVLPTLIAAAGAAIPQERYKGVIVGGLAAYGSMPPLVLVLLFVGCSYAGACL